MEISHQDRANGASYFTVQDIRTLIGLSLKNQGLAKKSIYSEISFKLLKEMEYLQKTKDSSNEKES